MCRIPDYLKLALALGFAICLQLFAEVAAQGGEATRCQVMAGTPDSLYSDIDVLDMQVHGANRAHLSISNSYLIGHIDHIS